MCDRVGPVLGAFAAGNPTGFHRADGAGYALVAGQLLSLDRLNPQVAARMMTPFGRWRRYDPGRQELMRAQLERILAETELDPQRLDDAIDAVAKRLLSAEPFTDAIKEARGITIDRHDIRLGEPIKTVGTRMVEVEVSTGVIATVKTMVVEDK